MKVLYIEDNQDIAKSVVRFLEEEGYTIDYYQAWADEIEAKQAEYDCMLLDINLPGISGYDIAKKMRENGYEKTIIAITARDSIKDKLDGFEGGFTDYVVKPFDLREVVARIRAHTSKHQEAEVIEIGDYQIYPKRHELKVAGESVELTAIEFKIILQLIKKHDVVVTAEEISQLVWGDDDAKSHPIRMHLTNLRKKIGDTEYTVIKTMPGIGYKFISEQ